MTVPGMTPGGTFIVVGFALTALLGGALITACWKAANERDRHANQLAELQAWADDIDDWIHEQFGGPEPRAIADDPTEPIPDGGDDTEPMAAVDLAGGLRTRPTPRPRPGRHRAPEEEIAQ